MSRRDLYNELMDDNEVGFKSFSEAQAFIRYCLDVKEISLYIYKVKGEYVVSA